MKKIIVRILDIYHKYISVNMGQSCRFHPSCSEYAIEAINKHGLFKGIVYSAARVLRCNPFSSGGYDPV